MAPRVQDGQSRLGFSLCAAPRTRYQVLHPELPEDRGQSPVIGGSGPEDRGQSPVVGWSGPEDGGQSSVIGGSGPEDLGLGIVSTWVEGRQSRGSNDIGSKTRGVGTGGPGGGNQPEGVGTDRSMEERTGSRPGNQSQVIGVSRGTVETRQESDSS
ncbi:hypothetical protein DFH29DRAFT_875756 [Suillus ampliporus]|nr:hypothetical protein DFH29DRAFT_875756 [Suillus ampliporus]